MKKILYFFAVFMLVMAMTTQVATNVYAEDSERSFEGEHTFHTLGNSGIVYTCSSYGSDEAVLYKVEDPNGGTFSVVPEKIYDAGSEKERTIVGLIGYCESSQYDSSYDRGTFLYDYQYGVSGIKELTIPASIRFIGRNAFEGFKDLEKVTFNSKDITIEKYAFSECPKLTTVNFNVSGKLTVEEGAFYKCTSLESISFPAGSDVSEDALYGCSGLKSIVNAPSLVFLGGFYLDDGDKAPQLQYVSFMPGLTEIGGVEFSINKGGEFVDDFPSLKTVVLPEGVKTIKNSAFDYFTGLTTINLPSTLETIEDCAFTECSSLTGITALPAGIKEVGNEAFMGCRNLKMAVSHPGDYLTYQYRDSGITSLAIQKSVVSIHPEGLQDCPNLTSITVQNGNTEYKSVDGVLFSNYGGTETLIKYPAAKGGTSYAVPEWVGTLGAYAFDSCKLTEIHLIPDAIDFEVRTAEEIYGPLDTPRMPFDNMQTKPVVYIHEGIETFGGISFSDPRYTVEYEKVVPEGSTPTDTSSSTDNPSSGKSPSIIDKDTATETKDPESNVKAALQVLDLLLTQPDKEWSIDGCRYKVLTNISGSKPGTVTFMKAKNAKSVTVPSTVKLNNKTFQVTQISAKAFTGNKIRTVTIGKNVKKVKKNTFKGSSVTKLIVKTKKLKKATVKGSLKGSNVKTIQVKVGKKTDNKKYVTAYQKFFTKANAGMKVTVK